MNARAGTARSLEVPAERLVRWVVGFGDRHGAVRAEPTVGEAGTSGDCGDRGPAEGAAGARDAVRLVGADGAEAVLYVPFPPLAGALPAGPVSELAARLAAHAATERRLPVLLVRRGGYACALVHGNAVAASKVGSRYVQSRTAAGGWSQQRFARRRDGQAKALAGAVVEVAARVLLPQAGEADALVTGGDRPLVDQVLADPRLASLARLPRGPHLTVGDPKSDVVAGLPERLRSVRIILREPA